MILDKFKNKKKDKSLTPSEGYKNYLKNIKIARSKTPLVLLPLRQTATKAAALQLPQRRQRSRLTAAA